jgi:hypothetical protein
MATRPETTPEELPEPVLLKDVILRCGRCGYIGPAEPQAPGKTWLEGVFWIAFVLPGFLYSMWRLFGRRYLCPRCREVGRDVTVPVGRKIAMVLRGVLLLLFVVSLAVLALVWNAPRVP